MLVHLMDEVLHYNVQCLSPIDASFGKSAGNDCMLPDVLGVRETIICALL